MRTVRTSPPSFPDSAVNELLEVARNERWQVVCGDEGHWRCGVYSPSDASCEDVLELEWHNCPELFLLLSGRLVLVLCEEAVVRELELVPGKPVLVTAPHSGYCPDGPHDGAAFVVERDEFETVYRSVDEWKTVQTAESSQS